MPLQSSSSETGSEWEQPTDDLANRQNMRTPDAGLAYAVNAAMNRPIDAFVGRQNWERDRLLQNHISQNREQRQLEEQGSPNREALSSRRTTLREVQKRQRAHLRRWQAWEQARFIRRLAREEARLSQRILPPGAARPDHHARPLVPAVPGGAAAYNPQMRSDNGERGRPGAASGQQRPTRVNMPAFNGASSVTRPVAAQPVHVPSLVHPPAGALNNPAISRNPALLNPPNAEAAARANVQRSRPNPLQWPAAAPSSAGRGPGPRP